MEFPDPDTIKLGLELTTRGSTAMNGVLSNFEKLKALLGKGDTPTDERDELIRKLMEQMLETRDINISLKEQLLELKEASLQRSARQERLDKYFMYRAPETDVIVYRLNEEYVASGETNHDVCPKCFQSGEISLLQGGNKHNLCTTCNRAYPTEKQPARDYRASPRRLDF